MDADINFYFDPVCPFAWMTSKWVRQVQEQRDYTVDWRFISLRLINAQVDYDAHFPPEYEAGHTAGLRLLRVAARARAEHGREVIAPLYAAFGTHIFDTAPGPDDHRTEGEVRELRGTREFAEPILAEAGRALASVQGLETVAVPPDGQSGVAPSLYSAPVAVLMANPETLLEERFGPNSILIEYEDAEELASLAQLFEGSLTTTIHARTADDAGVRRLMTAAEEISVRIVWNGWPTGVTVSPAMTHGGPYPASTSVLHTSVGVTSIRRFLRPITYQNIPEDALPRELRDTNPCGLVRTADGVAGIDNAAR